MQIYIGVLLFFHYKVCFSILVKLKNIPGPHELSNTLMLLLKQRLSPSKVPSPPTLPPNVRKLRSKTKQNQPITSFPFPLDITIELTTLNDENIQPTLPCLSIHPNLQLASKVIYLIPNISKSN